jgi:Tol biopolymer transport system component
MHAIMRAMKNTFLTVAIILSILAGLQAQTTQSSVTFQIEKMAFEVSHGGFPLAETDIFVRESPTSKPKRLVDGMLPVWSPDGQKLAFCKQLSPHSFGQVEVINADGSGRMSLTHLRGGACPTDWSSDGEKILAIAYGMSEPIIFVMDTNGGNPKEIANGYGGHWSRDGKQIVFCRAPEDHHRNFSIWIAQADGTGTTKVIDDDSAVVEAAWFADGKSLLFSSERASKHKSQIFRVNLDGSSPEPVAVDKHRSLFFPKPSPDGEQLVVDGIQAGEEEVLLLDLATGRTSVLAHGLHPSIVWNRK